MNKLLKYGMGAAAAGAGFYAVWRARNSGYLPGGEGQGTPDGPRVVILGAGFGGLKAAQVLRRQLGAHARITLVDRHNYHLFTPMLYQVAAWGLDPYDVAYPAREFASHKRVGFRRGMVTGIDLDRRRVQLDDGQLDYDYLIIALGSITNFFGNQAAQEHALPVKWLEDAIAIRNWTIDRVEEATLTTDPEKRRALLTFVIVGGGATGVETAGSLADLLKQVVKVDYPTLDPAQVRVVVVEMLDKLLGHMDDRIAAIALNRLRSIGVEVWLNSKPSEIAADHVKMTDGRNIATYTVLWTAGVCAADVAGALQVEHGKGGSLKVNQYLQVIGHPEVYAIGDNAAVEDAETHKPVPLLAQSAIQEGAHAARNIARDTSGQPLLPFSYKSLGDALALGRGTGVVESGGMLLDGFAGWLSWRVIHLARLAGFRDKAATILDWSWGYLHHLDTTRLEVQPVAQPGPVPAALQSG